MAYDTKMITRLRKMKTKGLNQIVSRAMKNVFALVLLLTSLCPAVALYWDANGSAPGAGGPTPTGTWGVDNYWNPTGDGSTTPTQAWDITKGAVFSAGTDAMGTFTVTVSGTQTATSLTFEEGNVTLSGGSLILTDAGGPINVGYWATPTLNTILAGSTGLTKQGVGALILGRTNTYTGATTIQAGVLQLGASGVLPSGSALVMNNSDPNRATLATGGFSQSLGALSVLGSNPGLRCVVDFGDGASALAFANSSGQAWNGTPLRIVNYTPGVDSLRFGTSSGGLTPTQLGLIQFADFANAAGQIDANGFVTPVLPSGTWVQITWSAANEHTYQVQFKNNLNDPTWTPLSPNILALGSRASTIDTSASGATRYYQVKVLN